MVSQPYVYQRHELAEPDWRRFPGWAGVSAADWESAQWQRAHCVKNARQLRQVAGPGLDEAFFAGTTVKSNFLCNLGYGDASKLYPSSPRLSFQEACEVV